MKTLALVLALLLGASGPALCQVACATGADPSATVAVASCHGENDEAGDTAGPSVSAAVICRHDTNTTAPTQVPPVFAFVMAGHTAAAPVVPLVIALSAATPAAARSAPPPLLLSLRI